MEPTGDLTLRDALAAALLHNPTLATFAWEVRVREARALQAGLPPNPEVEVEVEEFGGSGRIAGLDSAETTVLLSQPIELGRKRERRTQLAEFEQDLAAWDYEAARMAVLSDVARRFIAALGLQERRMLAQQNLELAEQAARAIERRVEAGAVSPLDRAKADVVVARTRIEVRRIERALAAARIALAGAWGGIEPQFDRVAGELDRIAPPPARQTLLALIHENPQIARWSTEMAQRRVRLEWERARAVPDLTAGAGVKHLSESDDTAAVVQFALPLPLFDRNQGEVLAARYALAQAAQARREAEVRLAQSLGQAHQNLLAAYDAVIALERDVLPASTQTYLGMETAYKQGKVGYLELLDAQRTLFDVQGQHLEALAEYHQAVIEVESLIGRPLSSIQEADPQTPESTPGASP